MFGLCGGDCVCLLQAARTSDTARATTSLIHLRKGRPPGRMILAKALHLALSMGAARDICCANFRFQTIRDIVWRCAERISIE